MLFNVCEHYYSSYDLIYYEKDLDDKSNMNECCICLGYLDSLGFKTVNYKINQNYIKECDCDGWIHNSCLDKWFKKHMKCIICRGIIIKSNDTIFAIIKENEFMIKMYIKTKEIVVMIMDIQGQMLRYLFVFFYYMMSYFLFFSITLRVTEHFVFKNNSIYHY